MSANCHTGVAQIDPVLTALSYGGIRARDGFIRSTVVMTVVDDGLR
jgi:hypothetical protein